VTLLGFTALTVIVHVTRRDFSFLGGLLAYPEDRYVAASLELFASVALLFWYLLRLYLSRRD
jgi:FtsH-binding integral membrane protein